MPSARFLLSEASYDYGTPEADVQMSPLHSVSRDASACECDHALVRERHRSREFIEFLKLLDAAYPASTRSS